ncbi:hypothetical protein FEZ51_02750 [Pediococcus stilesii]|uniref:Mga helix-turn-helix domain-containing protein n=1 Tax=Pediococcus stilesii TaxID=331679 RepID=A0A5R9BXE4_9LACO|nr:hypothetical protein [Pediococcus stilesii]TLQ05175.1 hypothetical protein FEZ51_02750 [Pediococcus stilesii]
MLEKFNRFLDDEQQLIFQMAEIFVNSAEKSISINYLQKELGISRHQVLTVFDSLEFIIETGDMTNVNTTYNGQGLLTVQGLNTGYLKLILKTMAIKSVRLNILLNMYLGIYGSTTQFLTQFGISRATYYRNIRRIHHIISEYFIGKRRRNEAEIRQVIFSIIHHFFDNAEVLTNNLGGQVAEAIDQLKQELQNVSLTFTEKGKLINFAFVQAGRIQQGKLIKHEYAVDRDLSFLNVMNSMWQLNDKDLKGELEYMYIYLVINELITDPIDENWNMSPLGEINMIIIKQINLLDDIFGRVVEPGLLQQVRQELTKINTKVFSPFYFSETFVDPVKVPFFTETYPELDLIVKQMLEILCTSNQLRLDKSILTQVYYAYMLFIMERLPTNILSNSVKIAVDFSNGRLYTRYISAQLRQFKSLNIEITNELNEDTDIFLSDQALEKQECEQVIWEAPPIAQDWELLGDLIVKIKQQ